MAAEEVNQCNLWRVIPFKLFITIYKIYYNLKNLFQSYLNYLDTCFSGFMNINKSYFASTGKTFPLQIIWWNSGVNWICFASKHKSVHISYHNWNSPFHWALTGLDLLHCWGKFHLLFSKLFSFALDSLKFIFNSYSSRTRRIWADIITNEAVGRVGYYQLISGKSEKNNCFSKFSSNSLYQRRRKQIFSDLQNFSTRNSPSVFPYLVKFNDNGSYHGLREPIRKLENHYPELKIY